MGGGGCCKGNHPIRDFFKSVFCGSDCCVGISSGPSASEIHVRKTAAELAEMKGKTDQMAREQENEIMDYINSSVEKFLDDIDDLNTQNFFGETLEINTGAIRAKNEVLKQQVVGSISKVMNTRIVQTDRELSVILEEKDDKKRKKNFEQFVDRVRKQAIDSLKVIIEKKVNEQSEVVSTEIKSRLNEVNSRLDETISEMIDIMEVKKKSDDDLRDKQIGYMYQSNLCDLILQELEG